MSGHALRANKNVIGPYRENLGEILAVFCKKYVKAQSMATAIHKIQKLVFNSANQKVVDFLDEFQQLAKDAFEIAAHAIIEHFINDELPPHMKKSINQFHLENDTYKQRATHLKRELELNGLEASDEPQLNTVSHKAANTNTDLPKLTC